MAPISPIPTGLEPLYGFYKQIACKLRKERMKKLIFIIVLIVVILIWILDFGFTRTIHVGGYSNIYKYSIFNSSFCNLITFDHCHTNSLRRHNAELELYKRICGDYKISKTDTLKDKIENFVNSDEYLLIRYHNLTSSKNINIDSIIKYEDKIFDEIALK